MTRLAIAFLVLIFGLAPAASPRAVAQSAFTGQRMPYNAFDRLPVTSVTAGGAVLKVAFAPGTMALSQDKITGWIEKSAHAVTVYFGRFPVTSARILIVPVAGRGVQGGQAFGYGGAAIRLLVGGDSTEADLARDWKGVHEMVHLALPDVNEQHLWLAEGLAVYVESIARVQAGDLTAARIWGEFMRDMPQGLPADRDRGLDFTPTWGRTYWGGAIFCLAADVEIRKRTGNKFGLQDAMRGVLAAGGTHEEDWPLTKIFSVADGATGIPVLAELYEKMRASAYAPDLDALWRDLGISTGIGGATFDDNAALAPIRRAITASPAEAKRL